MKRRPDTVEQIKQKLIDGLWPEPKPGTCGHRIPAEHRSRCRPWEIHVICMLEADHDGDHRGLMSYGGTIAWPDDGAKATAPGA